MRTQAQVEVIGGPGLSGVPPARKLAGDPGAGGQAVLLVDPAAEGAGAALACFGVLAEVLAEAVPGSSFVARFSEQLTFGERLALLSESLQDLPERRPLLLERPAAWGARHSSRQVRRRCRDIFDLIADLPLDILVHEGSADEQARVRERLLDLAETVVPPRLAELRHPERPLEALAASVLSAVEAHPQAARARRVVAAGAWASDWHPTLWTEELVGAGDPVADATVAMFERAGELQRLPAAVRHAARDTGAERWMSDGGRQRLLSHARERLEQLQAADDPAAHRALVEAARMAGELGDIRALADVGVLSSELLDIAATALRSASRGQARAVDITAEAAEADDRDGDARRHYARMLDANATELDQAASLYQQAIAIDPADVDAHEGLVSLWLVRADERRARDALHVARLDLEQEAAQPGPDDLLIPVAATALRRARTDFAREALSLVPPAQRSSSWRDHWEYLLGLEAARRGRDFVPMRRMRPGWWREGPELLARWDPAGPLREWIAGLVIELDDDEIVVEGARVAADDSDPEPTSLVLTRALYASFERDGLPFDDLLYRYVELGAYGDDPQNPALILRVHRRQAPMVPATILDPRRVLRPDRLR